MKDVALDLAEIDETYDTLTVSTGSGTTTNAILLSGSSRRPSLAAIVVVVIGLAGLGFAGWQWFTGAGRGVPGTFATLEIESLARIADMDQALLSADGRSMVYTLNQAGQYSLVVRQLATSQDVVVIPPQVDRIGLEAVAPDSSYVYFISSLSAANRLSLYRVPAVGGLPRQIMEGVMNISLSADGARLVAAVRSSGGSRQAPETSLVIVNADGTEPRTLATVKRPFIYEFALSPDGTRVVGSIDRSGGVGQQLVAFDVADGTEQPLGSGSWDTHGLAWLPDGTGLVASATGIDSGERSGVWLISWPSGAARRITNDTNTYNGPVSVSADGMTVATSVTPRSQSVWSAPADRPENAVRLVGNSGNVLSPLSTGRVLYWTLSRNKGELWTMEADGTGRQKISPESADAGTATVAALADMIVFVTISISDDGAMRLWRMDSGGGGLAEVAGGEQKHPVSVSPNGETVYFMNYLDAGILDASGIWKMPLAGGAEEQVGGANEAPVFSPNGRLFFRESRTLDAVEIVATDDDRVIRTLRVVGRPYEYLRWVPSSDGLVASRTIDGVTNLWRIPLDGASPTQVTHFGPGQFLWRGFTYSADGSRLLFFRNETAPGELLQFRNFR
jgi:Tol biopolymer transport system component